MTIRNMIITPVKTDFVQCVKTHCPFCLAFMYSKVSVTGQNASGEDIYVIKDGWCDSCESTWVFTPMSGGSFSVSIKEHNVKT